ncbi:hypothetical protein EDD75_0385 [Thermodesulfitimonas autotrophica]|uniref:Uncharacterized protein n=1 Tax=Thermodesulfitimonas autotrophica TaxID=1894989 RepID=A0A3N5BIR5_9THEO|nr:hypothetical protein [Thermodesulfitimonas autotrophica]RPF49568.1 hypothetical protein EDD75_0385 [Thermodesulfitimonas autotrophica]
MFAFLAWKWKEYRRWRDEVLLAGRRPESHPVALGIIERFGGEGITFVAAMFFFLWVAAFVSSAVLLFFLRVPWGARLEYLVAKAGFYFFALLAGSLLAEWFLCFAVFLWEDLVAEARGEKRKTITFQEFSRKEIDFERWCG